MHKFRSAREWETDAGEVYYAYDVSGLRTSLKDPDLEENLYVYDDAGRLSKMQVAPSRTAYFAYDASGMVVRRHAPLNEVVAYFTYDSAARLKQLENRAVTGALLSYFAYQRNALGAQTWIRHEGSEDTYFEYDPLDRLTREFRTPTGTARSHDDYYAYDAVGNRVLKVDRTASQNVYYTFDSRNLMAKEWNKDAPETTYFEHDAARRMKSLKLPGGQSSYFTHDQRDQVKKIEFSKASSPDSTQEFGYTGQGERVSLKIGNGSTTDLRMAYDGQKLLTEKNAASGSATVRRYRHNRSLLDCRGSVIEWEFGGTRRYGTFNGQGTLVGLLQDFGGGEVISDSIVRDAFGKLVTRGTVLGADQGKLQFLTLGLLDLQLTNVQMDPVLFGGGCFLPTQGVPLSSADDAEGDEGPSDEEKAAALVLLYWLSRNGMVMLCDGGQGGNGVTPPVTPVFGACGPDVTGFLYKRMILMWQLAEWAKDVASTNGLLGGPLAWVAAPLLGSAQHVPGVVPDWINRWQILYPLAQTNGPNDFKNFEQFVTPSCPVRPSGCNFTVTLAGVCVNYDVPGDIIFGFLASRMSVSEGVQWAAGHAVQLGTTFRLDPPEDQAAAEVGNELARGPLPTIIDLIDAVGRNHSRLNKVFTKGCVPCKERYPEDGLPGVNPARSKTQGFR